MTVELRNHDWRATLRHGEELAVDNARRGVRLNYQHVMWELLKEAAHVSKVAYSGPPRLGLPSRSAMPDTPDDITQWQLISAYLRGEVGEMPEDENRPPMPSAAQVSRAEIILHLWHNFALPHKGDRSRMKRAIYLKACGVPDRKVRAITGMTRQAIHGAKQDAMRDLWEVVKKF